MSLNFREVNKNTAIVGAAFRIDGRSTNEYPLFQWLSRTPGNMDKVIMHLSETGNLGVGTNDTKGYRLAVDEDAIFTKVKVKLSQDWQDYVFEKKYSLLPLYEVERFIKEHHHLPAVPSALEIEKDGLNLGENQSVLLRKIEELTLYIIQQQNEIEAIKSRLSNNNLKK